MSQSINISALEFYIAFGAILIMFLTTLFFAIAFLKATQNLKQAKKSLRATRAELALAEQQLYKYGFVIPEVGKKERR